MERDEHGATMKLLATVLLPLLVPAIASTAHAAPSLLAEPGTASKVNAPAITTRATASSVESDRAYLSVSLTSLPQVFLVPLLARAELGVRLGDSPAFLHVLGAGGIGNEVRGGIELHSSGSTRVFGGLDAGWLWSPEPDSDTSLMTVAPRIGIDAGRRVFFRGTLETALWLGSDSKDLPIIVMMSAGIGVRL